jgi:hypothetical protein
MSIISKSCFSQEIFFLSAVILLAVLSCDGKKEDALLIPPETSPLSRSVIGFGVVNVSYTHVNAVPLEGSASQGYLRRGSLVSVLERRSVKISGGLESWVLAEGNSNGSALQVRGWLREAALDIYDNEGMAKTASDLLNRSAEYPAQLPAESMNR